MKLIVRNIGHVEAMYRKCMTLMLGGGQPYDRSSDQAALILACIQLRFAKL